MDSIASKIRMQLELLPDGTIFTLEDIKVSREYRTATKNELGRIVNTSKYIERLDTGVYFKPKQSKFGKLPPSTRNYQINITRYANNKICGYEIGSGLFNRVGLTTQVPNEKSFISNKPLPKTTIINGGVFNVKVERKKEITKSTAPIFEFGYILNNIKKVEDIDSDYVFSASKSYLALISSESKFKLLLSELKGKSSVALLGALLEEYLLESKNSEQFKYKWINKLRKEISSESKYNVGRAAKKLAYKKAWNLI
ncbi:TPA: DUF6088 family protein [Vibrio diabolicus]